MKYLLSLLFVFPFVAGAAMLSEASAKDSIDTNTVITQLLSNDFPGSELLFFDKGDLNLDGLEDLVIVATRPCDENEAELGDENNPVVCRKVILALQTGKGNYQAVSSSNQFIDCSLCGGGWSLHDAFLYLTVGEGWFEVTQHYGACQRDIISSRYEYDKNRNHWFQTVDRGELFDCNAEDPSETTLHSLTETPVEASIVRFGE